MNAATLTSVLLNKLSLLESRGAAAEMTISEARSQAEWANLPVPVSTDGFIDHLRFNGFSVEQRRAGSQVRHIASI